MHIHEAILKARKAPSILRRPVFGKCYLIISGNPNDCIYIGAEGMAKPGIGWEPTEDDLTADDWMVTQIDGITIPETAPSKIQRTWLHFLKMLSR